jgi:hypothetical protein
MIESKFAETPIEEPYGGLLKVVGMHVASFVLKFHYLVISWWILGH